MWREGGATAPEVRGLLGEGLEGGETGLQGGGLGGGFGLQLPASPPGLTPLPSKMLWLGKRTSLHLSLSHGYRPAQPRSQQQPW